VVEKCLSDFSGGGCLMGEMHDQSDAQLLRAYAERGAEAAFAEIVARHTDLVYSAAVRQVYSPDLARDVTQSVFTDLARKAREVSFKLSPEASLVGWLYRGTQFAARDLYRNETRRTQRERQAMEQVHPASETPPDWEQLRPALDDAMSELDDNDRDAVLLRYFKNHDLRTVGATLGISDDAAQKRVSRAVERLREFFAKRGVTVGASGLAVVISANAVQAAPIGLAVTISTAAVLTGTTLAATATATATKAIAMTALQKTIVTTIAVLAGIGVYVARENTKLRDHIKRLDTQQQSLAEQLKQLSAEQEYNQQQLTAARDANEQFNRDREELLKLRADAANRRPQQLATAGNAPPYNNPYGLKPDETPAFIVSSISKTAKLYGYFIAQSEKGELSKAQAFALSKAWPYLEKRFYDPESFAQFQSDYLAAVVAIKDKDAVWAIRRAIEDARNVEYAKGLVSARTASDLQRPQVPEQLQKQFEERLATRNEQWATLNGELTTKVLEFIPENQRASLQTGNWKLLDFDPRLKSAAQTYANVAEAKDFAPEELLQASQLPGEKTSFAPVGTYRQ
jgi:RNA polymerase sigma factor (sigma-70 family)